MSLSSEAQYLSVKQILSTYLNSRLSNDYFCFDLGEDPTGLIRPKSCMVGDVHDVIITCAKFQIDFFMGFDFTRGQMLDFSIDLSMGLTTD